MYRVSGNMGISDYQSLLYTLIGSILAIRTSLTLNISSAFRHRGLLGLGEKIPVKPHESLSPYTLASVVPTHYRNPKALHPETL